MFFLSFVSLCHHYPAGDANDHGSDRDTYPYRKLFPLRKLRRKEHGDQRIAYGICDRMRDDRRDHRIAHLAEQLHHGTEADTHHTHQRDTCIRSSGMIKAVVQAHVNDRGYMP